MWAFQGAKLLGGGGIFLKFSTTGEGVGKSLNHLEPLWAKYIYIN